LLTATASNQEKASHVPSVLSENLSAQFVQLIGVIPKKHGILLDRNDPVTSPETIMMTAHSIWARTARLSLLAHNIEPEKIKGCYRSESTIAPLFCRRSLFR
jgi:hypothetical protein